MPKGQSEQSSPLVWPVAPGTPHFPFGQPAQSYVFDRANAYIPNALNLYAAGDWRYGHPQLEAGTRTMEAITALFEGPLCLAVAWGAMRGCAWRHPAQLLLTTCQLYGLAWFALHPAFDASATQHFTADPVLFWVVAYGLNAVWGLVCPMLWLSSWKAVNAACFGGHLVLYIPDDALELVEGPDYDPAEDDDEE